MASGDDIAAAGQAARHAATVAARGEPAYKNPISDTQDANEGVLQQEGGRTRSVTHPAQVPAQSGNVSPHVEDTTEGQKTIHLANILLQNREGSHEAYAGVPTVPVPQAHGAQSELEGAHRGQEGWPSAAAPPVASEAHPEAQYNVEEPDEVPGNGAPYTEDACAPEPYMAADAAPPPAAAPAGKDAGFDPALHARQAALGQLDRNKDGLITGDDLVNGAHEYEKLKNRVKWYRTCASIALVLLIIIVGIWIGIAILANRVTGGVKVVKGGFYVSRGNGKVVSTGRSLYDVPTPIASQLLTLTPAQLETLETVTFAVTGQPIEQHMKVAGLASRANFVQLRSGTGDSLTITPGAQTYASASAAATPVTVTSAYTFAPVK